MSISRQFNQAFHVPVGAGGKAIELNSGSIKSGDAAQHVGKRDFVVHALIAPSGFFQPIPDRDAF